MFKLPGFEPYASKGKEMKDLINRLSELVGVILVSIALGSGLLLLMSGAYITTKIALLVHAMF